MSEKLVNWNPRSAGFVAVLVLVAGGVGCKTDNPSTTNIAPTIGSPFSTAGAATADVGVDGVVAELPPTDVPTELYEIQEGDTLGKIAADHSTTVSMLRRLNGIEGSLIRYGQELKIPSAASPSAPAEPVASAAVAAGGFTAPSAPTLPVVPAATVPVTTPPAPPVEPVATPPAATPLSPPPPIGGAASGFGFGGESTPR